MNPAIPDEELWTPLRKALLTLVQSVQSAHQGRIAAACQDATNVAQAFFQVTEVTSQVLGEEEEMDFQARSQRHWLRFEEDVLLARLMGEAALVSTEPSAALAPAQEAALASLTEFLSQASPAPPESLSLSEEGPPAGEQDRHTAIQHYTQIVNDFYASLFEEARALLLHAYQNIRNFDLVAILDSLKGLLRPTPPQTVSEDELANYALRAVHRAQDEMLHLQHMGILNNLEEEIKSLWEALHQSEDALSGFLEYSFDRRQGIARILHWLDYTQATVEAIQSGTIAIRELTHQMQKTFSAHQRLFKNLERLQSLAAWLSTRTGLSFPLETILLGMYVVSLDMALLQGMDYADTTSLFDWVAGVITLTQKALDIASTERG